jgi:hypothetical protein
VLVPTMLPSLRAISKNVSVLLEDINRSRFWCGISSTVWPKFLLVINA